MIILYVLIKAMEKKQIDTVIQTCDGGQGESNTNMLLVCWCLFKSISRKLWIVKPCASCLIQICIIVSSTVLSEGSIHKYSPLGGVKYSRYTQPIPIREGKMKLIN